jgi:hypothetical protein
LKRHVIAFIALVLLAGCGPDQPARTPAELAAQRKAALEAAQEANAREAVEREARLWKEIAESVSYFQDHRTGICYSLMASRSYGNNYTRSHAAVDCAKIPPTLLNNSSGGKR